ncbi:unnamed protein product [Ectocarpus sp. CCAP 1310/34]|nr:unnamed protein product [Ectocarpus sp. CCAP 1310/34]
MQGRSPYEGNWANDERNGHGTYCYASGAVYEGSWNEGKMHGKGRYTGASGSCYDGMYRYDFMAVLGGFDFKELLRFEKPHFRRLLAALELPPEFVISR